MLNSRRNSVLIDGIAVRWSAGLIVLSQTYKSRERRSLKPSMACSSVLLTYFFYSLCNSQSLGRRLEESNIFIRSFTIQSSLVTLESVFNVHILTFVNKRPMANKFIIIVYACDPRSVTQISLIVKFICDCLVMALFIQ